MAEHPQSRRPAGRPAVTGSIVTINTHSHSIEPNHHRRSRSVLSHRGGAGTATVRPTNHRRMSTLALSLAVLAAVFAAAAAVAEYNVVDYGARPGGGADSAGAFLAAWAAACNHTGRRGSRPVMRVPAGRFLLSKAYFKGPCRSAAGVVVAIDGTVVAPPAVDSTAWIMFHYADGLAIRGGTLDGQGRAHWACRADPGRKCPPGTTTLDISQSKGVSIKKVTLLDSKNVHISIYDSTGVTVQGVRIVAPADSPNTDGIHVQLSRHVNILGTTIGTGDDCVSMGPGTSDVLIRNIKCGPGHGISIGSLGGEAGEEGVSNVTVEAAVLTGTQNGLRIKTWGKPNRGSVTGVVFSRVTMRGVHNPIVVDQNYCPGHDQCPGKSSGVRISDVSYTDIEGTSATPVAVKFDCSGSNPCTGFRLSNIRLTYEDKTAQSLCRNADGSASGVVSPRSCL
ncbi:polygalacturonase-like [Lolium rigidum]|uniref:polygalacturonase-like n=1 Tax=Lolium rigidum TaxID=89674 RepID=UPI001F5C3529|nr:polygalacturonase-like [Lolium rigidum]